MEHMIDRNLLNKRVKVHLVGVGGNGAQMAACLARLDIAMRELGHPYGLHVRAFDADRVSKANVGRQLYSAADVGRFKSIVTIDRLNRFYGIDWEAFPARYEQHDYNAFNRDADIVVSCVDARAARRTLHRMLSSSRSHCVYWMDLGNSESDAQVILGEPAGGRHRSYGEDNPRLPCVTELYPDLLDESVPDDNQPSCSVRMSLASQGLFINDTIVRFASHLLYELFSRGRLSEHGVMVNLATKRSSPLRIDPETWRRFGYPAGGVLNDPSGAALPLAA